MTIRKLIDLLNTYPLDAIVEVVDNVEEMALDISKVEMEDGIVCIVVE
jgi:hypothetical protein